MKKFVKLCLHLSYIVQNSFHFDEIFHMKFKIPILLFMLLKRHLVAKIIQFLPDSTSFFGTFAVISSSFSVPDASSISSTNSFAPKIAKSGTTSCAGQVSSGPSGSRISQAFWRKIIIVTVQKSYFSNIPNLQRDKTQKKNRIWSFMMRIVALTECLQSLDDSVYNKGQN